MTTQLLKIFTFVLLLKSIKTELYADYSDNEGDTDHYIGKYEDFSNPNELDVEQNEPHALDNTRNAGQNEHYAGQHEHYAGKNKHYVGQNNYLEDGKEVYNDLSEHTMVTDSNVFPYMVTILKDTKYLSSGALIEESWVLTTADGLFLMGDSIRFLRIRLGSINYKKGGVLRPVKLLEIHPYFDDRRPNFDLALIMLAKPVLYTPSLRAIRIQVIPKEVTATHFVVTSWPGPLEANSKNATNPQSMEMIKRHRTMTVTHLHPSDPEDCAEELKEIGATAEGIMCLEPPLRDPCVRDVGAPVVLNNVLWAVVSSWKPDDCDESSAGPIFATFVASRNVSNWIHSTVHGHRWI